MADPDRSKDIYNILKNTQKKAGDKIDKLADTLDEEFGRVLALKKLYEAYDRQLDKMRNYKYLQKFKKYRNMYINVVTRIPPRCRQH